MPTSATGISTSSRRLRSAAGFTLLELLIVCAVVGIIAGAAMLSLRALGPDRQIEQEVRRLRSLIDLIHEEALLQSRDFGVMFTATGYRFYMYDYGQAKWLQRADDKLLSEHELKQSLTFALVLDDRQLVLLPNFKAQEQAKKDPTPQVFILSSGELTPFEASVFRDRDGGHFALTGELNGTLTVSEAGFESR